MMCERRVRQSADYSDRTEPELNVLLETKLCNNYVRFQLAIEDRFACGLGSVCVAICKLVDCARKKVKPKRRIENRLSRKCFGIVLAFAALACVRTCVLSSDYRSFENKGIDCFRVILPF